MPGELHANLLTTKRQDETFKSLGLTPVPVPVPVHKYSCLQSIALSYSHVVLCRPAQVLLGAVLVLVARQKFNKVEVVARLVIIDKLRPSHLSSLASF